MKAEGVAMTNAERQCFDARVAKGGMKKLCTAKLTLIALHYKVDAMLADFPLTSLLAGRSVEIIEWQQRTSPRRAALSCLAIIALGVGCYGFSVGVWRGLPMGSYVAIKLPLVIALTLACNGLLNGLLSAVLGTGLGFRQTLQAMLLSYTVFALITGALAPVVLFLDWCAPSLRVVTEESRWWHNLMLVLHTLLIAYAGLLSHVKLLGLVTSWARDRSAAVKAFFAWTLGNLFVGAQMAWVLRPYFVSPGLEVAFLRPDPMRGNFYETVGMSMLRLLGSVPVLLSILFIGGALLGALFVLISALRPPSDPSPKS